MDMKVKAFWIQESFDEYSSLINGGEFNVLKSFRKATEIINHGMAIVRMIEPAGFVKNSEQRERMNERIKLINQRWDIPNPPARLRSLRNSLEHFEQKMDEWVTKSPGLNVVDFNYGELVSGLSNMDYFRNLNKYDFFFRKQSVNLKEIYEWSKEISICLES
ncbi:hypothetical protein [Lederbergia citrea]|uniref:Uncharacterized protein n=1 Tax=Lederbergia citrea TaxID=2833581 RepID=A0A942UR82_9BACI|nr:hypothetical protein [Lederbergia citrea]MBS4223328.1 hypothetical protein [Lederbergia citrea]